MFRRLTLSLCWMRTIHPICVWISVDRRNMQVTVDEHTGGVAWEKDRLREWVELIEIVEWIRNIENAGEGSFIGRSVCFLPEPCFWVQGLRDFMVYHAADPG